jgi:tripartite-type tricarboxylate transporter receptor subunit TctC
MALRPVVNRPRRKFLQIAAGVLALPALSRRALAQSYPSRTVRIVVGFPAGGTTDIGARLVAQWLTERLGQPFVIENRPGAGTHLATESVVRAPADGYTLLMATGSNAINATLYERMSYNFLRDLVPVAGVISSPFVLEVNPALPVKSVQELIAYAKADPKKVTVGSFGVGSSSHLSYELLKIMTGIDLVHVPYRGSAPMVIDLVGGQVQMAFDNLPASIEQIRAGKLRALAVTTTTRSDALPDIPAMGEILPGFEASAWIGLVAPRNTPADVIDKLNKEINAALADPKIKARLVELSGMVVGGPPENFGKLIAGETEKWGKVIRSANIKIE